jgi:hypothetical protein
MRSRYLDLRGGNLANPYLYVRAAVRYKAGGAATEETQRGLAFKLDPEITPAETVTQTALDIDEGAVSDDPPANVAFGGLPAYVSTDGGRALERALRERLDDQLAIEVLYDAQTKMISKPGEDQAAFAARVANAPAIATRRRTLETRLQSRRAALASKQAETKARGFEKWASLGTSILSNINILTGRKRTVTGIGGVLSKQRMESTARSTVERLEAEVAELERQVTELSDVDPLRFETRTVKPARGDVSVLRYDILWLT